MNDMKAVCQNLLKLSRQNQGVDKGQFMTFDILIQKSIGILHSPSCICVWNMKAAC